MDLKTTVAVNFAKQHPGVLDDVSGSTGKTAIQAKAVLIVEEYVASARTLASAINRMADDVANQHDLLSAWQMSMQVALKAEELDTLRTEMNAYRRAANLV